MDTPILSHTTNSASAHSPRGSLMVGLVWAFPHGQQYCLRFFHATIRFMLFLLVQLNYISVLLHLNFLFIRGTNHDDGADSNSPAKLVICDRTTFRTSFWATTGLSLWQHP